MYMKMEGEPVFPQNVRKIIEPQPDRIEFVWLSISYIQRVLKSLKYNERQVLDNQNPCYSDGAYTIFLKHKHFSTYINKDPISFFFNEMLVLWGQNI